MGFIQSGSPINVVAYLTEKGREYISSGNKANSSIRYFSIGDSDTNYNIAAEVIGDSGLILPNGFVPDLTGDKNGCITSITSGIKLKYKATTPGISNPPTIVTNPDGSITTIITNDDGTTTGVTVITNPNGTTTTITTITNPDGTTTTTTTTTPIPVTPTTPVVTNTPPEETPTIYPVQADIIITSHLSAFGSGDGVISIENLRGGTEVGYLIYLYLGDTLIESDSDGVDGGLGISGLDVGNYRVVIIDTEDSTLTFTQDNIILTQPAEVVEATRPAEHLGPFIHATLVRSKTIDNFTSEQQGVNSSTLYGTDSTWNDSTYLPNFDADNLFNSSTGVFSPDVSSQDSYVVYVTGDLIYRSVKGTYDDTYTELYGSSDLSRAGDIDADKLDATVKVVLYENGGQQEVKTDIKTVTYTKGSLTTRPDLRNTKTSFSLTLDGVGGDYGVVTDVGIYLDVRGAKYSNSEKLFELRNVRFWNKISDLS